MKNKAILLACIVVVIVGLAGYAALHSKKTAHRIIIGVITPLSGDSAYWGESTRTGAALAKLDLAHEGVDADVLVEDGKLEPAAALTAAQKLVNIDHTQAIYTEFNPATIAVSSFLKDTDVIEIYDATPVSPLNQSSNFYKTYLDYQTSCREVAQILKGRGITKVGVLKMNLEHGDLCVAGISSVYGADSIVESYNPGTTDFRTMLSKLNAAGAQVIFHASFQAETLSSLKNMRNLGMKQKFVGLSETVTPDVIPQYKDMLEGAITLGLPKVSPELISRMKAEVPGATVVDENAAALSYLHIKQLGEAFHACGDNASCVRTNLDSAAPDPETGFQGFHGRIAGFSTLIEEWKGGVAAPIVE